MKYIQIFLFILISSTSFGQWKQKVADELFEQMKYSKCVEMFEELSKKCTDNKKNADWKNVQKAGISNYHLFEMKKASHYFKLLKGKNLLTEKDREFYIESLRYLGKYTEANNLLDESLTAFPQNTYFNELSKNKIPLESLLKDSSLTKVKTMPFNSNEGDFGVSFNGNKLVFATKSVNHGFLNPKYAWDNDYFLNVREVEVSPDTTFSEPTLLKNEFISRAHDGPVNFSSDGIKMVITKNSIEKKKGKDVIHLSMYFSELKDGEWTELVPFEHNDKDFNVGHGVFANNDQTLYFVCDKEGGFGKADIYQSDWQNGRWSEPKNLGERINTSQNELFPFVINEQLYFASDGFFGLGGLDIFETNLSSQAKPKNLGAPINTSQDDFNLILDSTELYGYFSSNRGDNVDRIYSVKRKEIKIQLKGDVFAVYKENEPINGQDIFLKNIQSGEIISANTGENNLFDFTIDRNQEYVVFTEKEEFILLDEVKFSTANISQDSTFEATLLLKPTTITIHLHVVEKKSRKDLALANIDLTNTMTAWDSTLVTDKKGMVSIVVDRNQGFWAHGSKKGYIDGDVTFNTANEDGKVIEVELALPPIKKGEKFKLENIFYDLNKATLREESMASLDKLADFIIKNNLSIELSAHTDSRGSNSYNQRLSQARAQSCVDYLIKKGVPKSKMRAKGYGEYQLVNRCKNGVKCSEEEHQENRRTEVKILKVD